MWFLQSATRNASHPRTRIGATYEPIRKTKNAPRRPLRLYVKPQLVDFSATQHFVWHKARRVVTQHEGPERIAMEWWRYEESRSARDYFRVEDEEDRRYWLYRNTATKQWFLHGLFA